jgi:hypothetical protein
MTAIVIPLLLPFLSNMETMVKKARASNVQATFPNITTAGYVHQKSLEEVCGHSPNVAARKKA